MRKRLRQGGVLLVLVLTCFPIRGKEASDKYPVSGKRNPKFAELDESLILYFTNQKLKAATLTITRNGNLLHNVGFGWGDPELKKTVKADALLRIGNITTSFTLAVAREMIAQRKFTPQTKVFELLNLDPLPGQKVVDERLSQITVQHLLENNAGWVRKKKGYPQIDAVRVAKICKLDHLPTTLEVVRYITGLPLQTDPGEGRKNVIDSQIEFLVLQCLIEKVNKQSIYKTWESCFGKPLKLASMREAHAKKEECDPAELWYDSQGKSTRSRQDMEEDEYVESAYGGFTIHAGLNGLVMNGRDICTFLNCYWGDGQRRYGGYGRSYTVHGDMPGSKVIFKQRRDGYNFAMLLNSTERYNSQNLTKLIEERLDKAK